MKHAPFPEIGNVLFRVVPKQLAAENQYAVSNDCRVWHLRRRSWQLMKPYRGPGDKPTVWLQHPNKIGGHAIAVEQLVQQVFLET